MFVIPMYVLFFHLHLLNSYVGVSLADSLYSVPLGVLLMYTYMVTIPSAFFEAAHIDGASSLRTLLSVVLPLSMPAAATTALFAFLGAWGDYLFAATLMNGGNMAPASIGVYTLVATSANISVNWPDVMAASLILGLPTVLAVTLGQRYIRSGLNTGGLVG
jgi:multiple sugar transport system permease protein